MPNTRSSVWGIATNYNIAFSLISSMVINILLSKTILPLGKKGRNHKKPDKFEWCDVLLKCTAGGFKNGADDKLKIVEHVPADCRLPRFISSNADFLWLYIILHIVRYRSCISFAIVWYRSCILFGIVRYRSVSFGCFVHIVRYRSSISFSIVRAYR